jgi:predicted metal-dependent phosphoesterase TrpH
VRRRFLRFLVPKLNCPPVLKVELHAHTDQDPVDRITHTTRELVNHAASLGYGAVAVTLHNRYFDPAADAAYARERGILLLPGIERTVERRHLLLINFPPECETIRTFEDLARLKARSGGLVVAPHACYPAPSAIGRRLLDRHVALIDAIEVNAMYMRGLDFNRPAIAWARGRGKPMVGNSDLHMLEQMGTTYSLVDADARADAVCEAIRSGRVEVRSEPLPPFRAMRLFSMICWGGIRGRASHSPA